MEDDLNTKIKDLWLSGLTAGQVAKKLGITRSSVMGRTYRMRLSGEIGVRECDIRIRSIREEVKKLEKERVITLFDVMRSDPMEKEEPIESIIPIEKEPEPVRGTAPIKFEKLTYMSCRFVLNDGDPKEFLFCGKPKNGRSYCKEHEAICYYRLERRKKQDVFRTGR